MTDTLLVHDPVLEVPPPAPLALAPRGPLRDDAHLVLVDNGKAKAKELLSAIGDRLRGHLPIGSIELVSKPSAGRPLADDEVADLAERADVAIAGLGDCGACSACSLQDALLFERAGVPATVLITEVFVANVARFSETLGRPGYHSIVVPHPAATKSAEQLERFADAVRDAAATQLRGADVPTAAATLVG